MSLEPLPETREALLSMAHRSDRDLTAALVHQAQLAEEVVPNLVGLSVALVRDGLTFTIAATPDRLALLDAIQYAFGGPRVDADLLHPTVLRDRGGDGLLDEQRWVQFARAGAADGVMSTLSMPVHADGRVVAALDLYASTPHAFAGREQRLATVLGAWAPGAVHNADLSFSSRDAARQAPRVLQAAAVLDEATGVVVARHAVARERAREMIAEAAHRTGRSEVAVARGIVRRYLPDDGTAASSPLESQE